MSLYLYGVTSSSHPLHLDELSGLGGEAPRPVVEGGLAAVVGPAPDSLRAKRRDLLAHQDVVTGLLSQGTVLPMQFGLVLDDEDAVRAELTASREHYAALLEDLDGRVELNVKVSYQEEALLRQVLAEDQELRERNERLRNTGGGSYQDRLRFGELVAAAVDAHLTRAGEHVLDVLRPLAVRVEVHQLGQGAPLSASFLVEQDAAERFTAAAQQLDGEFQERLEVRCNGPLPPYSFVQPAAAAG